MDSVFANPTDDAWAPQPEPWTHEEIYQVSELAYLLYREGAYQQAVTLCRGLVAVEPGNGYARKCLALSLSSLGQNEAAWHCWNDLAAMDPLDFEALAGRCETAIELGRWAEAQRDLKQLEVRGAWSATGLRLRLVAATSGRVQR
jgi:tetratricopeptide (TPR) repeat protein